jgi:molybdate transport system ATP-binding protein
LSTTLASEKPALNDISVKIRQSGPITLDANLTCIAGQLLALVGASGSGKSTILRMIAGLSRPRMGRIAYGKQAWFDSDANVFLSPQQRRIGYLPQHYGLFPHMSALDNVRAGLHHLSKSEQTERAYQWLSRMHLSGLEHRQPGALSGGQQQRVAMARALAGDPSILLLDEPFSAVDSATREKLHGELAELKTQLAIPIVMVTHDLNEALMLADRMTLLSHGITLQSGLPREIIARPANQAAAQLVGIRNLFDSEIVEHDVDEAYTRLRFGSQLIHCAYRPGFRIGEVVRWVIPDSGVRFRAISRVEEPSSRNRLEVTVSKMLTLGDEVRLTMQIDGVMQPLQASIPLRLATELGLCVGQRTSVTLRAADIHLLPTEIASSRDA